MKDERNSGEAGTDPVEGRVVNPQQQTYAPTYQAPLQSMPPQTHQEHHAGETVAAERFHTHHPVGRGRPRVILHLMPDLLRTG